jgi:hypothetical protein
MDGIDIDAMLAGIGAMGFAGCRTGTLRDGAEAAIGPPQDCSTNPGFAPDGTPRTA